MGKPKNTAGGILAWVKSGSKGAIFLKTVLAIGLVLLVLYILGYGAGSLMAHMGL